MDAFLFAMQLLVGAIFFMSATLKMADPGDFRTTVHKYAVVPRRLEMAVVVGIPALELLAALSLLSGELARWGAALAAALLLLFIGLVANNIRRKIDIECGCFGLLWRERTGPPTIVRDAILLAAALTVAIGGAGVTVRDAFAEPRGFRGAIPVALLAVVVMGSCGIALMALQTNRGIEPPEPNPENLAPPAGRV